MAGKRAWGCVATTEVMQSEVLVGGRHLALGEYRKTSRSMNARTRRRLVGAQAQGSMETSCGRIESHGWSCMLPQGRGSLCCMNMRGAYPKERGEMGDGARWSAHLWTADAAIAGNPPKLSSAHLHCLLCRSSTLRFSRPIQPSSGLQPLTCAELP